MRLLEAHQRAMHEFGNRVHQVEPAQLSNPTPCTEWSVRDLLNHLVSEQRWTPWLLDGATLEEVGDRFDGDTLGDDPVAAWDEASALARRAWEAPKATTGEVYVTGGQIPAEEYGWQMTMDLAIHAWDLAHGIGAEASLDPELVDSVHEIVRPQVDTFQGLGIFAPPQPVAENADIQSRLLAMLGRRP